MSKKIDDEPSDDDALESFDNFSSSEFQANEDHVKSTPHHDSFLSEEEIREQMIL